MTPALNREALKKEAEAVTEWHSHLGDAEPSTYESMNLGWALTVLSLLAELERKDERVAGLVDALEKIALKQQETLAMIQRNGFIFDEIGAEPGNWKHLAFSIYTDLCQVDLEARSALDFA